MYQTFNLGELTLRSMATVSITRVVLGEMSNSLIGDLGHVTRIVVRVVLDMLSASIWEEDRVGSRDRPSAIGGLARVEVGPVVVVVHTVLVVVRMRLLPVVGGRWMIGRLMDDRRRRRRRCMVEAGTNMSVSVMTTVVRHGEEQRREEEKKLHSSASLTDDCPH